MVMSNLISPMFDAKVLYFTVPLVRLNILCENAGPKSLGLSQMVMF
jgi:hypothetical protein